MEGDDIPVKRRRTSSVSFTSFGNHSYSDAHISTTPKKASYQFAAVNDDKPDLPHTPNKVSTHDGIRSPTRASFMSPTRASLARFNPHLLPFSTADGKPPPLASSRIQWNSKDSRPELNSEKTLLNKSVTPALLQEQSGIDGKNPTVEADWTAPEPKTWAGKNWLPDTTPRRSQTPQTQESLALEVGASLPKAREDNQQGPATLQVQLNAEPHNSISADRMSNKDPVEMKDLHEHESEPLKAHPQRLFESFSEITKSVPASVSKELMYEPAPEPPDALLFSSSSIEPWGMRQPGLNSSPPASLNSTSPISGAPSLKPRTSLGPRKLVTKAWQFEAVQLGDSTTSSSATGFSRNDSSLAQRLALFLPFSKPPKKLRTTNSRSEPSTAHGKIPIKVIVTEGTSPPSSEDLIPQEQHTLPQSPQEPLIIEFHLSIDRKTQKYTKLDISSISPWANVELGKWLRTEAVNLDRSTIEETISRYWELSKIRATCWHRCEHDLKHDPAESHDENSSPLPKGPPKGPPNPPQSSLSSFQAYLGQQSLCLTQFPGIVLLIDWRVAISRDGSVQSLLSGRAGFPDSWTKNTSGAAALGKIGEAFDLLVQEFGVFEAVPTSLLFTNYEAQQRKTRHVQVFNTDVKPLYGDKTQENT